MTDQERQIIRSTLETLTHLVYKLMKEQKGLSNEKIKELQGYEDVLKSNIERLNG